MTRDLAEALRRDDLYIDGDDDFQLLKALGGDVLVVELPSGALIQALAIDDEEGRLRALVPLVCGPVQGSGR